MASTSYLVRAIFKEHSEGVAGSYKLLVRAKSMPTPVGSPNPIESTTLEDDSQTYEMGIKKSDAMEITGNLEKEYLQEINKLGNKKVDVIFLYGTDGVGGVAKYIRTGTVVATPSDVGGVDEILGMSVTFIPSTQAEDITDDVVVTDNGDGTFTVAEA